MGLITRYECSRRSRTHSSSLRLVFCEEDNLPLDVFVVSILLPGGCYRPAEVDWVLSYGDDNTMEAELRITSEISQSLR